MKLPSTDPTPAPVPTSDAAVPPAPPRTPGPRAGWWWTGAIAAGLTALAAWRSRTAEATPTHPPSASVATRALPVAVAKVGRQDLRQEITVPAEFRAYTQVDIHARIAGFLEELPVDLGDEVKAGQLLARLEVPELVDETDRAAAALARAEAEYKQAHLAFTRLQAVEREHANLVAQQDLDAAEARDATAQAAVAAARAEVGKYQNLLSYTRITAPFDGIVTRRFVDPGALVQAGTASATQSVPLVRISDQRRLRLDFPVSVAYVKDVRLGLPVAVRVESLGGLMLTGIVSRCAHTVDETTRTMTTEVEVPNPDLRVVPGMYASVVLRIGQQSQALAVPAEALPADRQGSVLVVTSAGTLEERKVQLGLETPAFCEVLAGLREGELVAIGSRSEIRPGQAVEPRLVSSLAPR